MQTFMGIDGGGTNLRVVIVDENLRQLVLVRRSAANPNTVGREASARNVQETMTQALRIANLSKVTGVGIGIAGAAATYASGWLRETVLSTLPDTFVVPSSDNEIALVGGTGERYGLMLLAGTGSGGFGINRQGAKLQVGGWGYLLGDEGSGYALGLAALKALIYTIDTGQSLSPFLQAVYDYLNISVQTDIVQWVYQKHENPVSEIAKIASVVLDSAEHGALDAKSIVDEAVDALRQIHTILLDRLQLEKPPIVFAGGLLSSDNILSRQLTARLNLSERPTALYEPVVGAALLAKIILNNN